MSFLGNIVSKILHPFGGSSDAKAAEAPAPAAPTPENNAATASGADVSAGSSGTTTYYGGDGPATTGALPTAVDVSAVMADLAAKNADKHLNWKTSIVDLLKLLDLDSSLAARKGLADELHYTGDKNDTATMNIWLHKEVLKKVAENGGKVPADLIS